MNRLIIAGPCALESWDQVYSVSRSSQELSIPYVRAMLFKPRTQPGSFQGLGAEGLPLIKYLKNQGHKLCIEVCSLDQLEVVSDYADIIQIGARNMQNFELLKGLGQHGTVKRRQPLVMLKRGFAATAQEWLGSVGYIAGGGVPAERIILCERGSRSATAPSGVCLDLALAWTILKSSPYKVICDPSHGTGDAALVAPLSRAILAMGFDGLMIESHPYPSSSVSDAKQAISYTELGDILGTLGRQGLKFSEEAHVGS